ncbi:MAG: Rrf2 family transcriptional regulator [Thermoanaerobacterales bacterium]|nr:Rrf2 family transcriptional regulator [Thermoanaerobacterales bacterium]
MRISHKVDYGVRAVVAIARHEREHPGLPVKREAVASDEAIPPGFLHDILRALRTGGVLRSSRGPDGGWNLARPAGEITVADVIRVLEGPLASVRGIRPHELPEHGGEEPFVSLWVAVRTALRDVLEHVTVADLAAGRLPPRVAALVEAPDAWAIR